MPTAPISTALYPALTQKVAERVEGRLGAEADANVRLIREALRDGIEAWPAATSAEVLKRTLVGLACDADLVLDLHCDAEAAVHLYTLTASAETFAPLAALLGAEAVLLADEFGDDPFDEAVSRPWHELRGRFPDRPIPLACQSATVELRGEADVSLALGTADAEALVGFLTLHGAIAGAPPPLPPARCAPTPLAASEPILAPAAGILAFRAAPGDRVAAGDTVADIVDPLTGTVTAAVTASSGVLYARLLTRFVSAGQRIGKVAGTTIARTGKLLGA